MIILANKPEHVNIIIWEDERININEYIFYIIYNFI